MNLRRRNLRRNWRGRKLVLSEKIKLEKAVKKLTLKREEAIDHKEVIDDAAKLLNNVKKNVEHMEIDRNDFEEIKERVAASKNVEELVQSLQSSQELQQMISNIEYSRIFEQLLKISSLPDNPIGDFPLDINRNHYSDIIHFGITHAPDALGLIMKIATKNNAPIAAIDVVRCAWMFSSLACSKKD